MPLATGDQLDHYRIEEHIADASTASIFKGTDLQTGQPVALKVPQAKSQADILFYDRLHREAANARSVRAPRFSGDAASMPEHRLLTIPSFASL